MKQKVTRFALTLLVSVLTATTAWAQDPSWLRPGDSWDATTKTLTVNTAEVAQGAYWHNNVIENVIISNSVTSIGANAFYNCTNLKTVFVSNDVTSIGAGAFYGCTNLKTVFIGNGVTSIGAGAFYGCTNLKTVFVGNGVTGIGDQAFDNCTSLKTVIMTPSSAPQISYNNTFYTSPNLKIYVPVGNNGNILQAYRQNYGWSNYYNNDYLIGSWLSGTCAAGLKDGVLTVVGFGAFEDCIGDNSRPNINSIVIEEGVTSIGDGAFDNCGSLATITVDANNQTFDSPEGSNAIIRKTDNALVLGCKTTVIPASVTSIGASAFSGCSGLTTISIPASVTSIGASAFYGCSGLTTISIPDGVTSIGDQAFFGCSGLTTVSIPDGVQSIGYNAFGACSNLESVHIGSGVSSIAESAFSICHKLEIITVDANNQTFDSREGCNAIIRKTDNALVAGCKTTVIPNSVTSIGDQAFYGHDGLTSITIPNSVTSIGISAFYSCNGLSTVTIGSGVTSIGGGAFMSCDALESVTIYATSVPTLGSDVFWGNKSGRKFYVFSDCVDAYKAAWGTYANDVEAIAPKASGTCGAAGNEANVTWQVAGEAGNYILYISGTGDMAEYDSANDVPWATYKASITTAAISAGVTMINSCAFNQGTIINLSYTGSVPDGYAFIGYTVTDAGSNPVSVTGNNGVYTFTMPASNVTVTANLIEKIPYIDENGTTAYCTNYTVLDNTMTTISAGWYVVKSNVTFSGNLSSNGSGEMNFILCDGDTLKANNIDFSNIHYQFRIYGQSQGTGTASISGDIMGSYSIEIYGGNINATGYIFSPQSGVGIYGGNVTAAQISGHEGSLYLKGGTITANELEVSEESIILTGATVKADSYQVTNGNVTIDTGKTYYDGTGAFYTAGNLDDDQITAITGKTLVPVTLSGTCGVDDPATGDVDESQNVTWLYDISTHTLTISGTGDMAEYASANDVPWATYKVNITTAAISAGVTTINSCAFNQGTIINLSYTGSVPDGYTFIGYTVTDAGSNPVSVTENNGVYTFTMPASDVTVNLAFDVIDWATQSTGDSESDPYIIYNKDQLNLLATNVNAGNSYSDKFFKLGADIAYSHTTDWDNASSTETNYTPIGGVFNSSAHPFSGTFDGDGHTISGIRISDVDRRLGLFGLVQSGTVKNVTITDMRITGYSEVGGIVGENYHYSRVENCHATATVALNAVQNGAYSFGGIVGHNNQGNIIGCSSAVTITTSGTLTNCLDFGGIVGCTQYGNLRNCLAVGVAIPDISFKDYYQNDVTASGAIAGSFDGDNNSHNYYSGCTLGGTPTASGIGVGWEYSNKERHDVTANNGAVPATLHTLTLGEGITASGALINQSGSISVAEGSTVVLSYSGSLSANQIAVFSLNSTALGGNTFTMPAANATVSASTATAWGIDGDADGSAAKPYVISRCAELDLLAQRVNSGTGDEDAVNGYTGKYFVLANDIAYDPNGVDANGENYTAIGISSHSFKGTFDGQGHTISGIRINSGNNYQGLFSYIENGTVKNITLADASITGNNYVGGIVGHNEGTIENCLAVGTTVRTTNGNGGVIVGDNWSSNLSHNYYSDCELIDYQYNSSDYNIGTKNGDEYQDDGAVYAIILSETEAMPAMNQNDKVVFRRSFTQGVASTVCLPFGIDATQAAAAGKFYTFAGVDKSGSEWEVIMQEADTSVEPPVAGNEASTLTANTPYLFMPAATGPVLFYGEVPATVCAGETSDTEGWTFHGTYEKRQWDDTHNTDEIGRIYGFAARAATSTAESGSHNIQAGNFIRIAGGPNSYALPFRAYLKYEPAPQNAPRRTASELPATMTVRLVSNIGGTTAVTEMRNKELGKINDGWFTLDGRKLDGKPSAKGVYINNGRKTVIK